MTLIAWHDKFTIGIPAVDHEHRRLIELINRLYAALIDEAERPRVSLFFGELFAAISAHFALEERFMRDHGYGALATHKADHERLLDEIRDMMDGYESGDFGFRSENMGERLIHWFGRHFQTHDAALHARFGAGPG
jgi:hemerythrin-like metal-binding protein